MEQKIESLWEKLKALPWYLKFTLGILLLLAIVGLYALLMFRRCGDEGLTGDMIVKHSKSKTDKQVADFRIRERVREKKRAELKQKREEIKTRIESTNEEDDEFKKLINSADTADDLLGVLDGLRERNQKRKRRR